MQAEISYREKARLAIEDKGLRQSLSELQNKRGRGALKFWDDPENQAKRDRLKASRMRSLLHLDILLAELASKIRQRGGQVYFAKTADEAVHYTAEVAKAHDVRKVIKGKSMTTLEIGLDPALQQMGIEVLETDLGEYIVQLAGDDPSHIISPCIHMNKAQISKLFNEKLAVPETQDPEALTLAARKVLRKEMLEADMGVTGCNLACAETGQISLVSNEGNIRMVTTLPKIHVAIMGMERIVPNLQDHSNALQLLTRSAALQDITTYVSFIGGALPEAQSDGPKEFHLVILDNGRSKILGDGDFREMLSCIHCGACLNACPVYGRIGGHAYNSVYPGPMGAVFSPLLDGMNKHADLSKGETLCGACKDICPVGIDIPRMLLALRKHLAYGDDHWNVTREHLTEQLIWSFLTFCICRPRLYRAFLKLGQFVLKPWKNKDGWITRLPGPGSGWTQSRNIRPIASQSFHKRWQERQNKNFSEPEKR